MTSFLINPYRFGVKDPNFANVSLLLHGDGTNESTTITDNSPSPKTVTAVGNAQISTAQSKFGGASILFDGSGDRLTVSDNADFEFGSGDFTLELWAYITGGSGTARCFLAKSNRNEVGGIGSFAVIVNGSNKLVFLASQDTGPTSPAWQVEIAGPTSVALDTWHHVACTRSGNVFRSFLNGTLEASTTQAIDLVNNAQLLTIGTLGYVSGTFVNDFSGYIDELRITKDVARYTANFTPPTAPFPDS